MQADRVRPAWALCIDRGDAQGLRALVTEPGFDFQQSAHFLFLGIAVQDYPYVSYALTPIGYSLWKRALWALELLLDAGANPDAEHVVWYYGMPLGACYRPIEFCSIPEDWVPRQLLECLLHHGASTHFVARSSGRPFIDRYERMLPRDRKEYPACVLLAAHARELRACSIFWCANHAGGCWPDMASLLHAILMREELPCDTASQKRRRK
jgi:hypothetical protein